MPTLHKLARFGKYTFWHSLGLTLPLAIDRLVVCPVLNKHLGSELFGGYVWVMGIMNLFGNIAANGFAVLLMRDLVRREPREGTLMIRTANILSGSLTFFIVPAASLGAWMLADDEVRSHAWAIFVPLFAFTFFRSFQYIAIAVIRVCGRGFQLFLSKLAESAVLLCIVWIASRQNLWWIGILYAMSILVSLPVAGMKQKNLDLGGGWDSSTARWLMSGWFAGALLTIADQGQVYAARVMLGAVNDTAEVATFYAGSSIGNLFVFPVGLAASSFLSLLSSTTRFALAGKRAYIYAAMVLGLAVSIGTLSYLLGKYVIELQYPNLAAETLTFYSWLALANGCTCVGLMMRPVAVKYGRLRRVAWVSIAALIVQMATLAVLVSRNHARGAAIAFAISSFIGAILWLFYFARLVRSAAAKSEEA